MEQKADAASESKGILPLLHALIFEGSFLMKHVIYQSRSNTAIRGKTLETLLKLNKKIDDLMKTSSSNIKPKKTKKNGSND